MQNKKYAPECKTKQRRYFTKGKGCGRRDVKIFSWSDQTRTARSYLRVRLLCFSAGNHDHPPFCVLFLCLSKRKRYPKTWSKICRPFLALQPPRPLTRHTYQYRAVRPSSSPFNPLRYVGLCINMSVGIWAGKTAYYLALLWTGAMTSFFMVSEEGSRLVRWDRFFGVRLNGVGGAAAAAAAGWSSVIVLLVFFEAGCLLCCGVKTLCHKMKGCCFCLSCVGRKDLLLLAGDRASCVACLFVAVSSRCIK